MEDILTSGGNLFVWIVAIIFGALAGLSFTDSAKEKSKAKGNDNSKVSGH